ncbi:putative PA14 domain-containing protein [Seiridium cardinale]|uniref:PA14 domain-containing protein n=1 Tax=Seiridium cardinale TaxID=138064 RepID=A0ABR2Y2C5_9PEZI
MTGPLSQDGAICRPKISQSSGQSEPTAGSSSFSSHLLSWQACHCQPQKIHPHFVNHGYVPPPNLSTAAHGVCKDSANLRVAVDEWNAAHLSRTNHKTVQGMCGCLEVQVAKGGLAQFSKCTIPKELKNVQARALANACASFERLMGIQRTTTTVTTKPTSSSTRTTVSTSSRLPSTSTSSASWSKAATAIAKGVVTIFKPYYNLAKFLVTGNYNQSFNLNVNMAPRDALMVKSLWDDQLGFKFYHFAVDPKDSGYSLWDNAIDLISDEFGANAKTNPGVDFWCVNCGVQGDIKATAALKAKLGGIKNAELQIHGNFYAGTFLGIDALATIKKKNTKTLLKQGLPGLSIPKIFTLGPSVSLGVSAEARIELIGRALAGASLNWENINGTINFLGKSKTITSGFTPVLNGTLPTTKKSKLILSLGLPVANQLQCRHSQWKVEEGCFLTKTPSLQAVMDYEEVVTITGTTADGGCDIVDTTPSTKCFGVYWNITAVNDVELSLFDVVDYNLFHWESKVIADGCVGKWADNSSKVDTCSSDDNSTSSSTILTTTATTNTPVTTLTTQITTTSAATATSSSASACTPITNGMRWAYYAASNTSTSVSLSSVWFIIDYVGYIYATTSGTYTFYASSVDDEFFMWWGSKAYSGHSRSNVDLYQALYNHDVSTTIYLSKGQYLPIRIMSKQVTGPGYWYFSLYDPNYQDLLSYYYPKAGWSVIITYTCDGSAPGFNP